MPKTKTVTFAQRLRTLREAAGLTQMELADRSGVSQSVLSLLESGKRLEPNFRIVVCLADVLGVSTEKFR